MRGDLNIVIVTMAPAPGALPAYLAFARSRFPSLVRRSSSCLAVRNS